jgi:hypothetical protein
MWVGWGWGAQLVNVKGKGKLETFWVLSEAEAVGEGIGESVVTLVTVAGATTPSRTTQSTSPEQTLQL